MKLRKHYCDGDFYEIEDVDKLISELSELVKHAHKEGQDRYHNLCPDHMEREWCASKSKKQLAALIDGTTAALVRTWAA